MKTMKFRVYGKDGHRQKMSFTPSVNWDFTEGNDVRILSFTNSDKTGTNDYTEVSITCNSTAKCLEELWGQISDGYFENVSVGKVVVLQYIIRDRQTGTKIEAFDDELDAENELEKFEDEDRLDNCYTEDFYEIVENEEII